MRLSEWRENEGLTQAELAREFGIHVQYVSAIERGSRTPGAKLAQRIIRRTGGAVSFEELMAPFRRADREAA